jgi:S1-C subfamily serine protease
MNYRRIVVFILSFNILFGCSLDSKFRPKTDSELMSVSVTITNLDRSSGGSGAVLESQESESIILTNAHVCHLIKKGGIVIDASGQTHLALQYKESKIHDLCIVKVMADLKITLKLARHAPERGDELAVVGHPALLPVLVTRGSYSEMTQILIQDGERECTQEEKESERFAFQCMIFGRMPAFILRDSQVVSATIMAGSSGSPVFNSDGELQEVIFAGQGALSYGIAVPWEYLYFFIKKESKAMPWTPISNIKP